MVFEKSTNVKRLTRNDLERRLKILTDTPKGLHASIRYTLLSCRIVGLLPLSGLTHATSSKLRFCIKSRYGLYYVLSMIGQFLMAFMNIYHLIDNGSTLVNLANCIFYLTSMITSLINLKMALSWAKIIKKVEELEMVLPLLKRKMTQICNAIMALIVMAAFVEHVLSLMYSLKIAQACDPKNLIEVFFSNSMPWIFNYTPYSLWKGVIGEILNIQSTFMWSFNDLILMVCSIYLAEHFIAQNRILREKFKQGNFYLRDLRVQHLKAVELFYLVNKSIGHYVIISFECNLYWICMQLFNSLNKNNTGHFKACVVQPDNTTTFSSEHSVYFTFSFTFLMIRTLLVSLLAAKIPMESVKPLLRLYNVPSEKYDIEVQRYIDQIRHTNVALSGLDFFYITRRMMLSLLGTIVTYELVLLQFNIASKTSPLVNSTVVSPMRLK